MPLKRIPTARRLYKNTILEALSLAMRFEDATVSLPPPDFWPSDAPALNLWRLDLCPTPSTV